MKVASVLAPSIYRMDNGSFRVIARVGNSRTGPRPKERRFPKGTALRGMRAWQEDQRAELRRLDLRPARGTLAEDVENYLTLVEPRLVSFKDRKYDLSQWLPRFGHHHRHTLEPNELQTQLNVWRLSGLSAQTCQTCNLRRTAISNLSRRWTASKRETRFLMCLGLNAPNRHPTHCLTRSSERRSM